MDTPSVEKSPSRVSSSLPAETNPGYCPVLMRHTLLSPGLRRPRLPGLPHWSARMAIRGLMPRGSVCFSWPQDLDGFGPQPRDPAKLAKYPVLTYHQFCLQ